MSAAVNKNQKLRFRSETSSVNLLRGFYLWARVDTAKPGRRSGDRVHRLCINAGFGRAREAEGRFQILRRTVDEVSRIIRELSAAVQSRCRATRQRGSRT